MLVKEMHIEFDIGLQKIASKTYDNFLDEEKDALLNWAQLQFIKNRINPKSNVKQEGFQDTEKRYDDLEELITPLGLPVYKKDDNTVFGILPYNYFHLIKSKSKIAYTCDAVDDFSSISTVNKYITVVPFPNDTTSPIWGDLKFVFNDGILLTTLFNVSSYTPFASGLPSTEHKFELVNAILQDINRTYNTGDTNVPQVEVRWENYNGKYYKDSLVFISDTVYTNIQVTLNSVTTNYTPVTTGFTRYSYTLGGGIFEKESKNRLIKTFELDDALSHSFATTKFDSPISTLNKGFINIHHQKRFILNTITLDFIRKPRKINLSLEQSCELNPNTHEEVTELAYKRASALISAGNYKGIIQEQLTTE